MSVKSGLSVSGCHHLALLYHLNLPLSWSGTHHLPLHLPHVPHHQSKSRATRREKEGMVKMKLLTLAPGDMTTTSTHTTTHTPPNQLEWR